MNTTTKTTAEILSNATGARSCEVCYVTPSCITRNADDRMYCHFDGTAQKTKGGRDRNALVAKKNEQQLLDLVEGLEPTKPIVSKVPRTFDEHGCRMQYAADLYHELASDEPTTIYRSKLRNKVYDRNALKPVSKSLGFDEIHLDVVVKNYADKM